MGEIPSFEDFVAEERAKDAALDLLFQDFSTTAYIDTQKENLISFISIDSFFFTPLEQQDNFLARIFQNSTYQPSSIHSIDSLFCSLSIFFKDHSEFIREFLSEQFTDIFKDHSARLRLENQFVQYPQLSLSTYTTHTNVQAILTLLFYPIPFLISTEQFISSLIEQEFRNYNINLQEFVHQETQIILSLSNHLLPGELSHKFKENILPCFIQQKCVEHTSHNLFPLLMDHPDSFIRIDEFTSLLKATHSSPSYEHFQNESVSNLLHPGSNTTEILTYYLSAIQTIQTLTLPHHATDLISSVIFSYLKGREDTFRCIISTFLTQNYSKTITKSEEEGNQMFRLESGSKQLPSFFQSPDSNTPSTEDIVGIFTNIYGSKELFILEYRSLLADRILSKFEFDLATEFSNLAKLEAKFGESYFTNCQVMLKDIAFSLDFQAIVHNKLMKSKDQLACYILSHNFWPTFMEETLAIPLEDLESSFLNLKSQFETLKPRRTLEWKTNIGLVELEVSLDGNVMRFSVSPIHAVTLLYFRKRKAWILKDMASMMKVPVSRLRKKLNFWVLKGVLSEIDADFFITRSGQRDPQENLLSYDPGEDMDKESNFRPNQIDSSWSYIKGILTTNALSLDRLHSLLTIFLGCASTDISYVSIKTLEGLLEEKIKSKELIFSNGLYSLLPN